MTKRLKKFDCIVCKNEFSYDYFGTKPPYHPRIIFLEEAYAMKDPFYPDAKPLCLGAKCTLCKEDVCVGSKCSLFYTQRFCLPCVKSNLDEFPDRIQQVRRRAAKPSESDFVESV